MLAPDGAFEVHDYKTGSNLPEQAELDEHRQLALYQIGVQKLWPDVKEVRPKWHLVAFDVEMRSARTPKALEALKKELGELIDRIEAEQEFPPHESPSAAGAHTGICARSRSTWSRSRLCRRTSGKMSRASSSWTPTRTGGGRSASSRRYEQYREAALGYAP